MMRGMRKEAGVALVTAIFLLVILAGLATAVVSLSTSQQTSGVRDELGTRAFLAARSGMEWALFVSQFGAGATPEARLNINCQAGTRVSFPMPANNSLSGFTVSIGCVGGGASDPNHLHIRLQATACNSPVGGECPAANPGADYVQRTISAQL